MPMFDVQLHGQVELIRKLELIVFHSNFYNLLRSVLEFFHNLALALHYSRDVQPAKLYSHQLRAFLYVAVTIAIQIFVVLHFHPKLVKCVVC